uniref:Uncharacterized protein n=1 Tax=Anguilla anguilla TaxID=7936 RepID=A0A0E9SQX8_ANGAN
MFASGVLIGHFILLVRLNNKLRFYKVRRVLCSSNYCHVWHGMGWKWAS